MISHANARKPVPFPAPQGSRALPVGWTPAVDAAARAHAHEVSPHEAAGILENGAYVRITNVSTIPETEVGISDEDMPRVMAADAFFHSHPFGPACPSDHDMQFQFDMNKPCLVYVVQTNDLFAWGDMLTAAPLEGRAFRHGVHDCGSIVRDWYALTHGVTLNDHARGWEWWNKGQNIYAEVYEADGFVRIPREQTTQVGDLLLFKFNFKVVMHAAIVTGPEILLHHTAGRNAFDPSRVSGYVPRSRWARLAEYGLRRPA